MREILVAGDTNRLVAELTFATWLKGPLPIISSQVRINDLAAPPESLDALPLGALMASPGLRGSTLSLLWPS